MPQELQTRIAFFFCASALSGAFSGLLAYAIAKMHGVGGQQGWRWIFILEGLATVILGIATYFFMIDKPELSSKWMTPEEIRYMNIQTTIREGGVTAQEKADKFRWAELIAIFKDPKTYMQGFILFAQTAAQYGKRPSLLSDPTANTNTLRQQASNLPCLPSPRAWASRTATPNS